MRLNYEIIGSQSQKKCLFLHGVLGQGKNWRSFARHLSKDLQCLIYDQRGHGRSHKPPEGYTLNQMALDLKDLVEEVGWGDGPFHVVGHSMGGRVALTFANLFPQSIHQLVIVDIGPSSQTQSMNSILSMVESVPVPFVSRQEARHYLTNDFQQRHGAAMAQFMLTNIAELDSGQWGWTFSLLGLKQILRESREKDHWEAFLKLQPPTLLIRGENSTYLTAPDFQALQVRNPNIRGVQIENAGHWVHAEQPVLVLKALKDFFKIDGPGS